MNDIWSAKLWAWTHDPAEKALVLMRRPGGHEAGTVQELRKAIFEGDSPARWEEIGREADRQAAAADRPQFPYRKGDPKYPDWAQPRFYERPELIHPLSGERVELPSLTPDFSVRDIEEATYDRLRELIQKDSDGRTDGKRTALALWRFASSRAPDKLGALWALLPADSRVPDHSIFAHLDLVSALSGAMAADPERTPALLTVSIGPVQEFIAQARSTSDLWAASHLLARLAWEAMRPVADELGPDAILFPALRGNPLVDLWLRDTVGLRAELFDDAPLKKLRSDANPLFSAALPNRFVALVPASRAAEIASDLTRAVRVFAREQAMAAAEHLFTAAASRIADVARAQVEAQLADFPEVHWAAVPWSLATNATPSEPGGLMSALSVFHAGKIPFFHEDGGLWPVLCGDARLDGHGFFAPNRGALYSQFYELADRSLASAKALRAFPQLPQRGYRCSLCGEREWLCSDRADLERHREGGEPWASLSQREPRLAKPRERLCALCSLKRLWPELFCDALKKALDEPGLRRYNVSTHAMAVAPLLARAAEEPLLREKVAALAEGPGLDEVALPPRLARKINDRSLPEAARRFPSLLGRDEDDEAARPEAEAGIKEAFGERPEGYYALALLDGDGMGRWVSAAPDRTLQFSQSWHSLVKDEIESRARGNPRLAKYSTHPRPGSPARQAAISESLNNFALHLAPAAIERWHDGKLIYAGGDDILALLPVTEAPSALLALRCLYSGVAPGRAAEWLVANMPERTRPRCDRGYVHLDRTLFRAMGGKASLSGGLVIAHYATPLGAVLRAAREAEHSAKNVAKALARKKPAAAPWAPSGALAISLVKRAGGETQLVLPWWVNGSDGSVLLGPALLADLAAWLRRASRGFVYNLRQRLELAGFASRLSPAELASFLLDACQYQAERQKGDSDSAKAHLREVVDYVLATEEACRAPADTQPRPIQRLLDFLTVAEFLSRERRHASENPVPADETNQEVAAQ